MCVGYFCRYPTDGSCNSVNILEIITASKISAGWICRDKTQAELQVHVSQIAKK